MRFDFDEPVWPVDLDQVRLWPMEGEDGPRLQVLFDGLSDFGPPSASPARQTQSVRSSVCPKASNTSRSCSSGWRNGQMVGALDCIVGYPAGHAWTVGMLVVAERHRGIGIGSSVVDWLEKTAANRGATTLRAVLRRENELGLAFATRRGYAVEDSATHQDIVIGSL